LLRYSPRGDALQTVVLTLALGVFAVAAYGDFRARHVPNELPLAIGALAVGRLILVGDPYGAFWTVVSTAAVFGGVFLAWCKGLIGGGDAKLLAAATLLIGYRSLFFFLLLTSLGGAVLAFAVLAASRLGGPAALLLPYPGRAETAARPSVPYGVAIAAAAAWVLIRQISQIR
jgi:prepilin peptidase CpaA